MRIAIMQPYFLPYIGYWQLINAVDIFVVYDNIKYTKKGWINRNSFLSNGKVDTFTLPLVKSSDSEFINQKKLIPNFSDELSKIKRRLDGAYCMANYFEEGKSIFDSATSSRSLNLFDYLDNSIRKICSMLGITTKIVNSSALPLDHSLKGQERVIDICAYLQAKSYINPPGGVNLYCSNDFASKSIKLMFISSRINPYKQLNVIQYQENLSIIDLFFNLAKDSIKEKLNEYELLK